MEHKFAGSSCGENKSSLRWRNGLFSSVWQTIRVKKPSKLVSCIDLLKLHLRQMSCLISHETFQDYIKQQKKMQSLFSKP